MGGQVTLDVLPPNTLDDSGYLAPPYSVARADGIVGFSSRSEFSDFKDLGRVELGGTVSFPFGGSAFAGSICRVVSVCAKKQMRWINASPIVAIMKDTQLRGASIKQKVADAVRGQRNSVANSYLAIPSSGNASGPKPAFTPWAMALRLVYLGPKSLDLLRRQIGNATVFGSHLISLRSVVCRTAFSALRGFSILPATGTR